MQRILFLPPNVNRDKKTEIGKQMKSDLMAFSDYVSLYPVKLVFRETTGNALSFYSINDFYNTARRLCEESFVTSAPKRSAEFIVNSIKGKAIPVVLFVIEISEFPSPKSLELTIDRLKRLARSYDLELLGMLEKGIMTEGEEREEMLKWVNNDIKKT